MVLSSHRTSLRTFAPIGTYPILDILYIPFSL
jgi:hypothetical protein